MLCSVDNWIIQYNLELVNQKSKWIIYHALKSLQCIILNFTTRKTILRTTTHTPSLFQFLNLLRLVPSLVCLELLHMHWFPCTLCSMSYSSSFEFAVNQQLEPSNESCYPDAKNIACGNKLLPLILFCMKSKHLTWPRMNRHSF